VQNWDTFSAVLRSTEGRSIVEESKKDAFWGAKPTDDGMLIGSNVLGRLLMELREVVMNGNAIRAVETPQIKNFRFLDQEIGVIQSIPKPKPAAVQLPFI
jgi:hypothetical protein